MKILKFKCTLLSDIILSEQSATEGTQRTLDYIPGNVFLGVVAGKLYEEMSHQDSMLMFHSGKVRFGDAHPLSGDKRAIRVPASWQVKKGKSITDQLFVSHKIPGGILTDDNGNPVQPKQCRDEFIIKLGENLFSPIIQKKSFAIKSAYNKELRRSKDQQMYGYQSLEAGMEFCFQVELDNSISPELETKIKLSLIGKRTIGRSKTAQYGQVDISTIPEYTIGFKEDQNMEPGHTFLYAESRLLFIDENGQPFIPMDGGYYGLIGAKVILGKSQIRAFRYAPYNSKRQTRDADRFGIEKGSVICIDKEITEGELNVIKQGIGLFKNEGFGKVLINPEFLKHKNDWGEAMFLYQKLNLDAQDLPENTEFEKVKTQIKSDPVFLYLQKAKEKEDEQKMIFEKVDGFVNDETVKRIFLDKNEQFSSQWGTIRTKAIQAKDKKTLKDALFSEEKGNEGFLLKGQSAQKWNDKGRLRKLKNFFDVLDESITIKTMINLSSEMAKLCQKKGGKQ